MSKRIFDLILVVPGMLLLIPMFLFLGILVRIKLGTVFFLQQRPGLHGRPFVVIKFRTMTDERDAHGDLLPDSARITSFGQLLRATSLDELPELVNVLKGEMSLVGPRPLLMEYLSLYTSKQARRHEVLPGITGWAQVNGRNALSWDEKFRMDVWYVDNRSFWLDVKILFLTVLRVLSARGINEPGAATMSRFKGSERGR